MRFSSLFRKKDIPTPRAETTSYLLGSNSSVTSSTAQKIADVFACINIKANALAVIPIKTYKKTKNGKYEDYENSLYELLRYAPNENLTASLYKKMISQDLDLRGNHYSQIVRNTLGEVVALYPLVADKMSVEFSRDGKRKIYKYDKKLVNEKKILHIYDIPDPTGLKGISKIEYAKSTLEYAKNTTDYGNKLFKNNATPSGVFEIATALSQEAYNRLKESLSSSTQGVENAGKVLLLESGLTFKQISITNSDAQWLESRKLNRENIASIFGVPVAMLNDSENTSYGNLEQKYMEFYSGTIFPLTTILEEQFRLSLLKKEKRKSLSIKFKFNTMLRVDVKTRADYYKTRFDIGSISPNEIRELEDENGFDGGDDRYVQLNLAKIQDISKGNIDE